MLVTVDTFAEAVNHLSKFTTLVVDTETTGLFPWSGDRITGIAIKGYHDERKFYFAFRHGGKFGPSGNLPMELMQPLRELLHSEVEQIGYNYGFDSKMLHVDGFDLPALGKLRCVMLAAHLMNENEPSFKLKVVATRYVDPNAQKAEEELNAKARALGLDPKSEMWKLPASDVEAYACQDIDLTEKLHDFYLPHLETWKLSELWAQVNEYQQHVVATECEGMMLDLDLMEQYIIESDDHSKKSLDVLQKLAGYPINPNSAPQLQAWLQLPSTRAEILEGLKESRAGVKELLEFRWWSKVNANYYRPFQHFMDVSGMLHPNLNMIGTETGRLSSAKPPMQAIPVRDEVYKVKDVFVAGPDKDEDVLVEADYSQAELRVGSHYAQEKTMAEKLARGADIHSETAHEADLPRDAAKRMNFSVIYGIGKKTLAERLGIPERLAGQYLDKYHAMYPGFRRLYRRCEALATDRGYIRMFTGRLRHYNVPTAYTHKASSNLIQGSVAEMVRMAYTRCARDLGKSAPILLQVHDSLLFRTKRSLLGEVLPVIRSNMQDTPWCTVPMKVDIKVGYSWGHMRKADE